MPSLLGVQLNPSLLLVALGCLVSIASSDSTTACFGTFPEQRSRYFLKTLLLYQHYVQSPGSLYDTLMQNTTLAAGIDDALYLMYQGTKWGTASADKDIEVVATGELFPPTDDCLDVPQGVTTAASAFKTPVVQFKELKKPGQPISVLKPLAASASLPRVGWYSHHPHNIRVIVFFTDAAAPNQIAVAPPQPSDSTTVECDGDEPSPQLLAKVLKRENIALVPVVQESNAEYWRTTILRDAGIRGSVVITSPPGFPGEAAVFMLQSRIVEAIQRITCEIESDFLKTSTTLPPTTTQTPTTTQQVVKKTTTMAPTTSMTPTTSMAPTTSMTPTTTTMSTPITTSVPKKVVGESTPPAAPQVGALINAVATTTTTESPPPTSSTSPISSALTVSATTQTRLTCGCAIISMMMLLPPLLH